MNKVLIVHHIEPMWANTMRQQGTDPQDFLANLWEHVGQTGYDHVILTRFEEDTISNEEIHNWYGNAAQCFDDIHEYGYAWPHEAIEECPEYFAPGGSHSEAVLLPDWLQAMSPTDTEVYLCGAFDGECIDDMETALCHLQIPYQRLEHLIV